MQSRPHIGVFDSGFGGLTVLRALLPRIPAAHYTYLGDTARLPYGAKSHTTIARYAVESSRFLEQHGADLLVIACNTATALALPEITAAVSIPVIGVIEPVIQMTQAHMAETQTARDQMAPREPRNTEVLVLATAATVQSHAYGKACSARALRATEKACPLLVPLVEEGWTDHPVTRDVLRIYLAEALLGCAPRAVLLGCTHYPLIVEPIRAMLRELGSAADVIDSASATAQAVAAALGFPTYVSDSGQTATFACFATDSVEKFEHLGSRFLQRPLGPVQLLDLGG